MHAAGHAVVLVHNLVHNLILLAQRWGSTSSNPRAGGCLPPGALPVSPRGCAGFGGLGKGFWVWCSCCLAAGQEAPALGRLRLSRTGLGSCLIPGSSSAACVGTDVRALYQTQMGEALKGAAPLRAAPGRQLQV